MSGSSSAKRFTVPGRPMPAPRMTQRSKFRHAAYFEYKQHIAWCAKIAGVTMIARPEVRISVYIAGQRSGDWDNYGKTVCDALQGIAWTDDRHVVYGSVRKIAVTRKDEERLEVELRERHECGAVVDAAPELLDALQEQRNGRRPWRKRMRCY